MILKRRPPIRWPDNARIAVNFNVSFETWPDDLGTPHSIQGEKRWDWLNKAVFRKDLYEIMKHQFGERDGIYRLLELYQKEEVKGSFFLNGITVERFPELVREIKARGHELASQTYIHDVSNLKTPEQDRADIRKTVAAFKKVLGEPPLGYLSPFHSPTDSTPGILVDEGYRYWVDPCNEELPYTLSVNGKELVVIYYTLNVGDMSTQGQGDRTFRQIYEMWKDAFDWLYSEGATRPALFAVAVHPWLIGRPYRMKVLEEFFHYVKGFPDVWICRAIDVVNWWQEHYRDTWVEEWPNYWYKLPK